MNSRNREAGRNFFLHASEPGVALGARVLNSGTGLLFTAPQAELACVSLEEIPGFIQSLEHALAQGHFLAGYFTYEFGYGLERAGSPPQAAQPPLAWLGVFNRPLPWKTSDLLNWFHSESFSGPEPFWLRPLDSGPTSQEYARPFYKIKQYIRQGDTYQVNLTFPLKFQTHGDLACLFWEILRKQPLRYPAFLRGGGRTLLSFSPELFFSRQGSDLQARPMKGTASRRPGTNAGVRAGLAASPKERAENLMIVDLLRNDLGRICRPGTVRVPRLFQVEAWHDLYQMTSTIRGRLRAGRTWNDILRALYPAGSVTGAPKIRARQIIAELEKENRGVYTGTVGYISPRRQALFAISIRTLEVECSSGLARYGAGSGVVADSKIRDEWRECRAKAGILFQACREYRLLETLLWEPGAGYRHLDAHLNRLAHSAAVFGIPCAPGKIRERLERTAVGRGWRTCRRVRLLVDAQGRARIESALFSGPPAKGLKPVGLARKRVRSSNLFLFHKTTNRAEFDLAFQRARERGWADLLFCNERGALTEGAVTNLFVRKGAHWYTPPVRDGLLPGIERAWFLEKHPGRAVEKSLFRRDLVEADEIRLGNSVRGLFPVRFVPDGREE